MSSWLEEDFRVRKYTMGQIEDLVSSYAMLQNEDDGVNFSSGARILALIIRNFIGEGFGKSGYVWSNKPTSVPRGALIGISLSCLDQRTVDLATNSPL